tara:strand:- start:585 stop:2495 length:1911 start_codon:yes stop_codon:yes gene_type:complete
MSQQIIIAEQSRIAALLTDGRVDELIVAQGRHQIGDIYQGTVENVLSGIDAAFIDIGDSEKNGFIHVTDLGPLRSQNNAAAITELLSPKQQVLVQVIKEPTGNKGPRLSGNISLPGKYLILQPFGQGVNISRRINTETERSRLKALGVLMKPPGTGLLVRTEAENIMEELLIEDLEFLTKKWENLLKKWEKVSNGDQSYEPVLLNRDEDFALRILRDHINSQVGKIIIDDEDAVIRANSFITNNHYSIAIEKYNNDEDLLDHYKINQTIKSGLQPRVDLPSGGYIIIEPTEALTVIDVNSGSFTRSSNSRQTVLWTNCEAAIEIARQLKLRNIGGVIIIDFIDMDSRRDQLQLLEHFTSAIKTDSARPQISQLTELGLVELTRKRQGQNIYELFGAKCECCNGLGLLPKAREETEIKNNSLDQSIQENIITSKAKEIIKKHPSSKEEINIPNANEIIDAKYHLDDVNKLDLNSEEVNKNNEKSTINNSINIIPIHIQKNEEIIYRELGLNPLLKSDQDLLIHDQETYIIREGEDENLVLENAMNIKQNTSNTRRKQTTNKNKSLNKLESEIIEKSIPKNNDANKNEISTNTISNEELSKKLIKEIEEDNLNLSEDKIDEDIDINRRKRRRSSASDS